MIKIRFINKGFTLIELLVVITIMATIASIAVLSLRGTDSDTLADREVRRLYQLIKVASDSATLKNHQYGIRLTKTVMIFIS
jgi:general secretion pathway protein H